MRRELFLVAVVNIILHELYHFTDHIHGNTIIYEKFIDSSKILKTVSINKNSNILDDAIIKKIIMPAIFCIKYKTFIGIYNDILRKRFSVEHYNKYKIEID